MCHAKVVEKIKTHILCSVTFFFYNIVPVYVVMWKNIAKPDRTQLIIWRMRVACWITKYINAHSEYVILNVFPLQQWLHERSSLLRLYYIVRLVKR